MSAKSVAEKLLMKPGRVVLVVNPPPDYESLLGMIPEGTTIRSDTPQPADIIHLFVVSHRELEEKLATLKRMLAPNGILWVSYYKGSSKKKTDINRDSINAYGKGIGLEGVAMISIDDDWSALRFKVV